MPWFSFSFPCMPGKQGCLWLPRECEEIHQCWHPFDEALSDFVLEGRYRTNFLTGNENSIKQRQRMSKEWNFKILVDLVVVVWFPLCFLGTPYFLRDALAQAKTNEFVMVPCFEQNWESLDSPCSTGTFSAAANLSIFQCYVQEFLEWNIAILRKATGPLVHTL